MLKKVWLAFAIIASLATPFLPDIDVIFPVVVFLSIFSIAAGVELSERLYILEEKVRELSEDD